MISYFSEQKKFLMGNEEVMCRMVMAEKLFKVFVVMQYGDVDSSKFHDFYVGNSLARNGSLILSSLEQFIYFNSRLSSLQGRRIMQYIACLSSLMSSICRHDKQTSLRLQVMRMYIMRMQARMWLAMRKRLSPVFRKLLLIQSLLRLSPTTSILDHRRRGRSCMSSKLNPKAAWTESETLLSEIYTRIRVTFGSCANTSGGRMHS